MSATIAIVGRPNVGKSALFNRMLRSGSDAMKSAAITESTPGVTRDRNYGAAEWEGRKFNIIDTGGFFAEGLPGESSEITRQVKEQALLAVEEADLIIHLLDSKEDLNPTDLELANILRASGKKILWAANKVDHLPKEKRLVEFYAIGADEIIPVSAITGHGFDDMMDKVIASVPPERFTEEASRGLEGIPRVAIVGRPNAGKSTLINSLLGKQRLIVSPIPGTTRDAVDSVCSYYGRKYLFIDTAGIRKKVKEYSIEGFSIIRAHRSIEKADVVVVVLDISQGIVEQDQTIAGIAEEHGKGCLFLLNKWDLIENPDEAYKKFTRELKSKMWFMPYAPFITTSGIEKKRITKIFPLIDEIIMERRKRIPTGELNRLLAKVNASNPFPKYRGRDLKLLYMTQVETEPPAFAVFANYPAAVKKQHAGYIEKALREEYSFTGTPIRIYVKSR